MAPLRAEAADSALDRVRGYSGLAVDEEDGAVSLSGELGARVGAAPAEARRSWRLRTPIAALSVGLLAAAALATWRGGGSSLARAEPAAAEVKQALVEEHFTCAKYGCLDVATANACQCSQKCVATGNCCPDYQAVCVNPARHAKALGHWDKCPPGPVPPAPGIEHYVPKGPPVQVRVMSYNPEWWHLIEQMGGGGNSAAKLIVDASSPVPFDFIGFQEFYDPWFGLTRPGFDASALLRDYMYVRGEVGGPVGTIIAFRNATWSLLNRGQQFVAEDRQGPMYFGKRIALWARFMHKTTGKTVFFMNHHGPLPLNTGGICGGQRTAVNLLQVMAQHVQPGDAIIFTGDFNAAANSPTINTLSTRLHGLFAGIDHIFTNLAPAAVKSHGALGKGGSDHDAIGAVLELAGGPPAAAPAQTAGGPPAAAPAQVATSRASIPVAK